MDMVQIPDNINTIAVPTSLLNAKVGKRNDTYILVVMKRRPMIDIGCGARTRCTIYIDLLPSGGIRLDKVESEPLHFGITATKPPLMLSRQLPYGQFKLAFRFRYEVEELDKGELVSPFVVETPPYLTFERVSANEFKLTHKEPEAMIITYSYSLESRVACADIDVIESELSAYKVCGACCATKSDAILVAIAKEGQKVKLKMRSARYRERLDHIEKTLIVKGGKLVETTEIKDEDVI
jgi:hypothetical protein